MIEGEVFDYIIVGAGTAGCVLASRLKSGNPDLSILLVEAGTNQNNNESVLEITKFRSLWTTELSWCYVSVPQKNLDNRVVSHPAGKLIGGSSGINAGEAPVPALVRNLSLLSISIGT